MKWATSQGRRHDKLKCSPEIEDAREIAHGITIFLLRIESFEDRIRSGYALSPKEYLNCYICLFLGRFVRIRNILSSITELEVIYLLNPSFVPI